MNERISVIGAGKLGLCTSACLADAGFHVTGVDNNALYLENLRSQTTFPEPHLGAMLDRTKSNLSLTTDIETAVKNTDVTFIIVPTPSTEDGGFSNDHIETVLKSMAPVLKKKSDRHLINVVSTVMPESYEQRFKPLIEELTGKTVGKDIGYTYNPEFIALGSIIDNFLHPDFVLAGESDEISGALLEKIYKKTCKNDPPVSRTSVINAEIAKLSLNCFCTMKISFANQISELCDETKGSNAREICSIIGQDKRIGQRYFMPGLGFGGPCFPRDNEAFVRFSSGKHSHHSELQKAVISINNRQVDRAVKKVMGLAGPDRKTIAFLGLSYKPGTPVTERSQPLDIVREMAKNKEYTIRAFDPMAKAGPGINQAPTIAECVKDADVVVILTPWPEFIENEWRKHMKNDCVIMELWR